MTFKTHYLDGDINYTQPDDVQPLETMVRAIGARFNRNIGSLRFIRNPTGNAGVYGMHAVESHYSEACAMLGLLFDHGHITAQEEHRLCTLLLTEWELTKQAVRSRSTKTDGPAHPLPA